MRARKKTRTRGCPAATSRHKGRPTRPATPRQTEILTFIRDYQHKHGFSPTYDEIAAEYDISKVTVFEHLTILEERGLIHRDRHKARSLQLADHLELPDDKPSCLPLVGRIAAGAPIEAIEDAERLDLEALFASKHGVFVLEVKGDSMIDDHIAEGDYVVVEQRKNPLNGDIVVALLDNGEATLKRFFRERSRIRLQPANSKYQPIYATDLEIQGVVIGVIRRTH